MDNPAAKELLSAYRPNGADARDPIFREALDQCEHDPGLASWLKHQQAFDARISALLTNIHAPETDRDTLLATASLDVRHSSRLSRWSRIVLPMAAMLLIALGIMFALNPRVSRIPEDFHVARLADSARSLDHMADSADELRAWVRTQGAPVPATLPALFETAQGNGCKVFEDGRGGKVSLLCFSIEGQLVHLFVFDDQTRALVKASEEDWQQERGWNVRILEADGQLLAVATRGSLKTLDAIW